MRKERPVTQKTALVVDDSRSARFAMRKFLEGAGYTVDTAESAQDAYLYLQRRHPQVIFLDHQMPGSDGLDVLRALKDDEDNAHIPVVLCSGQDSDESFIASARAAGAVAVLAKPPDANQLKSLLKSLTTDIADTSGRSPSRGAAPARTTPSLGLPTRLSADLRPSPVINEDDRHGDPATTDNANTSPTQDVQLSPGPASAEIQELRQTVERLDAEVANLRQARERSVEQLLPALMPTLLEALEHPIRTRANEVFTEVLRRHAEQMLEFLRTPPADEDAD